MSLTSTPGDQRTQQLAKVNPISLRPTAAPIDLHARRINHEAVDAPRFQEAREPKGIVARLVAEYDRWLLATHLGPAITGRDEFCHQTFAVTAFEWIDACLLTIGKLDTQQPRFLAHLHGAEEPIRGSCRVSCSIHLPVSPLHPVTTWTKEIAGKLRRPLPSCSPILMPGLQSTMRRDHIRVAGASAKRRWRPSLTRCPSRRRN